MARAAFNVAVYPYRQMANGTFEYALLQRSDAGFWQGVSGGGEDEETPLAAAQRETFEETGIPADSVFLPLDTVEPIRVTVFGNSHLWGEDVYVVPQYCFGVQADGRLSFPTNTQTFAGCLMLRRTSCFDMTVIRLRCGS